MITQGKFVKTLDFKLSFLFPHPWEIGLSLVDMEGRFPIKSLPPIKPRTLWKFCCGWWWLVGGLVVVVSNSMLINSLIIPKGPVCKKCQRYTFFCKKNIFFVVLLLHQNHLPVFLLDLYKIHLDRKSNCLLETAYLEIRRMYSSTVFAS